MYDALCSSTALIRLEYVAEQFCLDHGMSTPPPRSTPRHRDPASFARIALAAGTGEDIAALTDKPSRFRWALTAVSARAILIVVLVIAGAAWAWINRPPGQSAGSAATSAVLSDELSKTTAIPSTTKETSTTPSSIVVYVSGAVNKPGVYTLGGDARVTNLLQAAGGATDQADLALLNLAEPLADGHHVHVPLHGDPASAPQPGVQQSGVSSTGPIDINTADVQTLQSIPGVGPATAQRIVDWRESHGRFSRIDDLLEISGIGEKTLEKIRSVVTVS